MDKGEEDGGDYGHVEQCCDDPAGLAQNARRLGGYFDDSSITFRPVTQTNRGIIAAQTIMQNGQRMWIEYRACGHSHTTKASRA